MTKTKQPEPEPEQRTLEQVEDDLAKVTEAERALAGELARGAATLSEAANASRDSWEEEISTGRPPTTPTSVGAVQERLREIPGLLWVARCQRLRLAIELKTMQGQIFAKEAEEAAAEGSVLEEKIRILTERLNSAVFTSRTSRGEYHEMNRERGAFQRELAALEASGPDFTAKGAA